LWFYLETQMPPGRFDQRKNKGIDAIGCGQEMVAITIPQDLG
jgi:hypothetical protein